MRWALHGGVPEQRGEAHEGGRAAGAGLMGILWAFVTVLALVALAVIAGRLDLSGGDDET